MAKKYLSTTGVDEFYYAVLNTAQTSAEGAPERVKFLQEITVSAPQEIVKDYGDNKVADRRTSNGVVEVRDAFHNLPKEYRIVLLRLKTTSGSLSSYGSTDYPPYVAAVFAKTH